MRTGVTLFGIVLVGCAGPPQALHPTSESGGPFASSQTKPSPEDLPALDPSAKSAVRLKTQASYFLKLKGGVSQPSKSQQLGPTAEPLSAGVRDLRAGALPHLRLELTRGQRVTLETANLSHGSDTVLHLLGPDDEELAIDDDGGDQGASRIQFVTQTAGVHIVLIRAYAGEDDGRCDLVVDGETRLRQAKFGGATLRVTGGATLHTVLLNDGQGAEPWPPSPRAASDTVLLLVDPESGRLVALDDDSGVELGSMLSSPAGREALVVLGALDGASEGTARVVVNDAVDRDGDGLGDGLERALCLCSDNQAACGFDCKQAVTPQDTDGDGLSDAVEVLGLDDPEFPQLLPRWGADPRHKDLFVEIDLADWTDTKEVPPVHHFGRSLSTSDAHAAARVYGRLTDMRNPDGADGVRLHLDVGHACGLLRSGIDSVCGDLCAWGRDGERRCGQSIFPGAPTPRLETLAPGRRHLFHIAISDCLVAGSAPGAPADHLEFDCDRFSAMVHELGHNLGLSRHYGTPETGGGNCKPNYPSLMNYAYSDRFNGGREVSFSNGSLVGSGDLDPRNLSETERFGGETAYVGWLATRPFYFTLHDCVSPGRGCKVDWNRDGKLDPAVRAYLSPMPNYGWICENLHGNVLDTENIEGLAVSAGPAGAELMRDRQDHAPSAALHAVAPAVNDDNTTAGLWISHTFAPRDGGWSAWQPIPGPDLRPDTQPAAVAHSTKAGAQERLHIFACRAGEQPILHATMDRRGKLSTLTAVPGQPADLRAADVSVARLGADLLLLVRDDNPAGGDAVYMTRLTPGGWSGFQRVLAEGKPLRSTVTPAAALGPNGRVYIVTGDPDPPFGSGPYGRLHLYSEGSVDIQMLQDEELWGVTFEDGVPGLEHVTWSRPALAFVPHLDGEGQPLPGGRGYLSLWWSRGTRMRHLSTWGRLDAKGASFSLGRWHHYEAMGYTDAIANSGPALVVRKSHRLTALIGQADRFPRQVRHIPYADGVPDTDLTLRDFDDRQPIRNSLCISLNWECKERCQRLSDPCSKFTKKSGTTGAAVGAVSNETHCVLPRWSP